MNVAKSLTDGMVKNERAAGWKRYTASLKYGFYVIFHPFDGFWDLVHEQRGSLMAAHTWLFLFLLTYVLRLLLTNFQFITAPIQYINVYEQCGSLLLPFLILCLANWALSTLFDGKGRFKDIYMAMCYALIPYVLIQLPMIFISNMISFDEAAYYQVLGSVSIIWCVFLVFTGLMQVHDYTPGKTLIFLFFTVFGALVILFLILVFFSLLSDAIGFFVSLYREIAFRLY
ncbi:MAG: YIP1 family protein [Clostridia bacterium]|nr:YIP1 family protein [Clostridia bacterium]